MSIPDRRLILGVPIDNWTLEETVQKVFTDLEMNAGQARYLATVNVDFLCNSWEWNPGFAKHPELLRSLRRADYVTADGMPIIWLSRLLGAPLKERVTGADLIGALCEEAGKRGCSVFFLGGKEGSAETAAAIFQERYSGLRVAGVACPYVHVEGEQLSSSEEQDRDLVDRINRSGADLLFIGFGNPKQEIWFRRVRHQLKVPLSVGIGGAFEFVTGGVARAPESFQRLGMEWVWRVLQEPRRLWKRYFLGGLQLAYMALPLVVFSHWLRFREEADACVSKSDLKSVVDLTTAKWMDCAAVAWLAESAELIEVEEMTNELKRLLKLYRVWDWMEDKRENQPPHVSYHALKHGAILEFRGWVEAEHLGRTLDCLPLEEIYHRDLTVDLQNCRGLDNFTLSFLTRLSVGIQRNGKRFCLKNPCQRIANEIEAAKLKEVMPIVF